MPDVKPDQANALRLVTIEHVEAMKPAMPNDIERELMQLRTHSHRRNEMADEAQASFLAIVEALKPYSLDIIRQAIRQHANSEKFFPRSPAELLKLVQPLQTRRMVIARNASRMADEAERLQAEAERLRTTEKIPIDEIRTWSPIFVNAAIAKGWITEADKIAAFPNGLADDEATE